MTREAVRLTGRTPGDLRRERAAPGATQSGSGEQTSISVPSGSRT